MVAEFKWVGTDVAGTGRVSRRTGSSEPNEAGREEWPVDSMECLRVEGCGYVEAANRSVALIFRTVLASGGYARVQDTNFHQADGQLPRNLSLKTMNRSQLDHRLELYRDLVSSGAVVTE
jgi:hypothetical protein